MGEHARGKHPNSLANLRPWKPGVNPNPLGTKGPLITPALRKYSHLTLPELYALDGERLTVAELIAVRYLTQAMSIDGDRARAETTDRLDGKVKDVLETRNADDDPWLALQRQIVKAANGNGNT